MLKRSLLPILVVALALSIAAPAAANDLRVNAMGGLTWVIDDDVNHYVNPANAAWVQEGYLSVKGRYDSTEYSSDDVLGEAYGSVYFIKPGGTLGGYPNVHGGWLTAIRRIEDDDPDARVFEQTELVFYGQEALRLSESLAIGGSVLVQPFPHSRTFTYDDGNLSEYKDKGLRLGFEGALASRLTDQLTLEAVLGYDRQHSEVDWYRNGSLDDYYTYKYSSLLFSAKAAYALSEDVKAIGIFKQERWKREDGLLVDDTNTTFEFGGTLQAIDPLLLGAAVEMRTTGHSSTTFTTWRGGAEYQLSDALALRGGVVRYSNDATTLTETDWTLGAGVKLGGGSLDLYALLGSTSTDVKSRTIQAAYTLKF